MEKVFHPKQRSSLSWNIVLLVALVLVGLALLTLTSSKSLQFLSSLFVALALAIAFPFFYLLYQYYKARRIAYQLDEAALNLVWGFNKMSIPLQRINWAHHLSEFENELPLPRWHIPGAYLNKFDIKGLGITRFIATDPADMILLHYDEKYIVISPEDHASFLKQLSDAQSLAKSSDEAVSETNFRAILAGIWEDRWVKTLIISTAGSLVLLWVACLVMIGIRSSITWVSLQKVPASQLLILALLGSFIVVINTFIGLFYLMQADIEKTLAYILLGSPAISCLILTVASLMMAL